MFFIHQIPNEISAWPPFTLSLQTKEPFWGQRVVLRLKRNSLGKQSCQKYGRSLRPHESAPLNDHMMSTYTQIITPCVDGHDNWIRIVNLFGTSLQNRHSDRIASSQPCVTDDNFLLRKCSAELTWHKSKRHADAKMNNSNRTEGKCFLLR